MLRELIEQAAAPDADVEAVDPDYAAHVLLGALRPDFIDEALDNGGTRESIQSAQAALVERILG
jgi:hypothetical protein